MPRARRFAAAAAEIALVSLLVIVTRCASWRDVFVGGHIYFTDADCYARMTRARTCFEHPFTIVRHHAFENFPAGTTPHTTAPFDYAIVGIAACLWPVRHNALDLAGAFVSPLIALVGGWFLWWWTRRMRFRWRIAGLLLYATSPIIAHGTELGRPDHQSLALLLVLVAVCAEWSLRIAASRSWSVIAGAAWGLAIWVSAYEPLLLFVVAAASSLRAPFPLQRWLATALMLGCALLLEQRVFIAPDLWRDQRIANWLMTIGEMSRVSLASLTWFYWCGLFVVLVPVLFVVTYRRGDRLPLIVVLLLATAFVFTVFQARWAYFFVALLAIALPALLQPLRTRLFVTGVIVIGFAPILYSWQRTIWPNEFDYAARIEHRLEMRDVRGAAESIADETGSAFIAPWWLSPAIAYWSHCNGVAGSSHESIDGIVDTARFYLAGDDEIARAVLVQHQVHWVVAYDPDRVVANSAAILGTEVPPNSLAVTLSRTPSRAPRFLGPVYQNGTCTVFSVRNSR